MQITAWKCEKTGKIFEHKVKYQSHLKALAALRRSEAKHKAFEAARMQVFTDMRNTVRSKAEFIAFIEQNWIHFCMNAKVNDVGRDRFNKKKPVVHPPLKFFKVTRWGWSDCVSNSHRCPIGGVTNWGGGEKMPDGSPKPNGYPGWKVQIEYQVVGQDDTYSYPYGSQAWDKTCINTGTGGYANNYYYGCELFAADWPAMAEAYAAAKAWAILNNDRRNVDDIVEEMFP